MTQSVTPIPEDQTPSSGLFGYCMHWVHIHIKYKYINHKNKLGTLVVMLVINLAVTAEYLLFLFFS